MNLYGNEPDFPVVATGTCAVCKRADVGLRETKDGRNDVCADLARCAMALIGVDDEILRAEIPPGEMWLVETPAGPNS